ncbi:Protein of unknown function [Flavobacterium indicum GPTSA100-9 = DSM 17447]|uniref:DUF1842 domain-containing protein n=1 Tax=Flavobacterium indicum (strain DSM 17447 / CIP 109464 / GPTSA100-9) TaxID=1094466 RepID=H8XPZ4_FLAIG|nr:DUF1842 domain-containing protein [Flavobacterium indicum]CCG54210.1 Protein of unknown function [Flavobacterium indicum GPTSA100-9 = DSM 17447]
MSTQSNLAGAYLAQGTIGNVGMPGAPIVHFSFVVVPSQHKVSGAVQITQATENGNYSGQVTGTLYATGLGNVTQIVAVKGTIHSEGVMPIEIPFEAHLAIDGSWNGTGGFSYANTHVESVPVTSK